jgi:hypothetical protein
MVPYRRFAALLLGTLAVTHAQQRTVWSTCWEIESSGDGSGLGDKARAFEVFLAPGAWVKETSEPRDSFAAEFGSNLKRAETGKIRAPWREVGRLGTHRIREIRYTGDQGVFAALILAEVGLRMFAPLMKWSGRMPASTIYNAKGTPVLVLAQNSGGNIPMVQTWAWLWESDGPTLLDTRDAVSAAIAKVAPGYAGYETGIDWSSLSMRTWVWKAGGYPGKAGVEATVEAWYELEPTGLTVQRAEFRDGETTVRWPSAQR